MQIDKNPLKMKMALYLRNYKAFNSLVGSDLGLIVDKLRNVTDLGYKTSIEKNLGLKEGKLNHYIKRFEKLGISFTAKVNTRRIGLLEYLVFIPEIVDVRKLPETGWLKYYSLTASPLGTFVIYYMPCKFVEELRERIMLGLRKLGIEIDDVLDVVFDNSFRFQPSFHNYNILSHPLVKGIQLKEYIKLFNEATGISIQNKIYNEQSKPYSRPYDIIDLLLLKEFEKNAFATISSISMRYPISQRTLNKHLNKHVLERGLITGIFMKSYIYRIFNGYIVAVLSFNSIDNASRVIDVFVKTELLLSLAISTLNPYYALLTLVRPYRKVRDLLIFLQRLYRDGIVESVNVFEIVCETSLKRTIPYFNYSQEERDWTLDLRKALEIFRRRFQKSI